LVDATDVRARTQPDCNSSLLPGIVQVPTMLLMLPVTGYVLPTEATTLAIIFLVWTSVAGLSDDILKPLMLGRGLEVPMPAILIGVTGGLLAGGLLGLFVGPVLLAVGHRLLIKWMRQPSAGDRPQIGSLAS
jgi:predicted PurR-regulated permease PerM